MDGELNELYYDNTKITFSTETNNIETSDELTADPIYQNQMGTKYSRSKRNAGKVVVITGVSVVASTNSGSNKASIAVSVGSTDFSPASRYILDGTSNSNSSYDFTGSASGTITITINNTGTNPFGLSLLRLPLPVAVAHIR